MKDRNDRRWLIAGIVFFALMIFCINTAYADSNLNKTDGQIKMQNDVIDFVDGFTGDATFSMNAEKITVDTLIVNSVFSFSGDVAVDSIYSGSNITAVGTVSAEQLTSTDDATITDDLSVGGNATVTGIIQGEHLYSTDDGVIADSLYIGDDAVIVDSLYIGGNVGIVGTLDSATLNTGQGDNELYDMDQNVLTTSSPTFAMTNNTALQSKTLAASDTTFALTSNIITLTGDAGANTLATITGAGIGIYTILFVDGLITVTDDEANTANTIDLVGTGADLTSADDTTLTLMFDGTSFYEVSRSVN